MGVTWSDADLNFKSFDAPAGVPGLVNSAEVTVSYGRYFVRDEVCDITHAGLTHVNTGAEVWSSSDTIVGELAGGPITFQVPGSAFCRYEDPSHYSMEWTLVCSSSQEPKSFKAQVTPSVIADHFFASCMEYPVTSVAQERTKRHTQNDCGCHPTSYTVKLNFSQTCGDTSDFTRPGILSAGCINIDISNVITDFAPAVVDRIDLITYDDPTLFGVSAVETTTYTGPFNDGDEVTLESYDDVHHAIFIRVWVTNAAGQSFYNDAIFRFTNACNGAFPIFNSGDKIGLVEFVDLAPPDPLICPGATYWPTSAPTVQATMQPSATPTQAPSPVPTLSPTSIPSSSPTSTPSNFPTFSPSLLPTVNPTTSPSRVPTGAPSQSPSFSPTSLPTVQPSATPTESPSRIPSPSPTVMPTQGPTPLCEPCYKDCESLGLRCGRRCNGDSTCEDVCRSDYRACTQTCDNTGCTGIVPSEPPTTAPTAPPTVGPTSVPSRAPTASPTSQSPTTAPSADACAEACETSCEAVGRQCGRACNGDGLCEDVCRSAARTCIRDCPVYCDATPEPTWASTIDACVECDDQCRADGRACGRSCNGDTVCEDGCRTNARRCIRDCPCS